VSAERRAKQSVLPNKSLKQARQTLRRLHADDGQLSSAFGAQR